MNVLSRLILLLICASNHILLAEAHGQSAEPTLGPPSVALPPSWGFECFLQPNDSPMPRALTADLLKVAPDYCAALEVVEEIEEVPYLSSQKEVEAVLERSERMFSNRKIPASVLCTEAAAKAYSSWRGLNKPSSNRNIEQHLETAHLLGMAFGPSLKACKSALRVLPQRTEVSKRRRDLSQ